MGYFLLKSIKKSNKNYELLIYFSETKVKTLTRKFQDYIRCY